MSSRASLGFIGAGNMAAAIAQGVLRSSLYAPAQLLAADPSADRRALFAGWGITAVEDSAHVAASSDILILAVKPQMIAPVIQQIRPVLSPGTLVISIIAGLSTLYLESALSPGKGSPFRLIRVMPNTPMLVALGMSALCPGSHATEADLAAAEKIFASAGQTLRVAESQMDAVTALSGSGPAYVFFLVEAMAAAGLRLGLSEEHAARLARQTLIGAGQLLAQSAESPAELRRQVTSPKGTTQAAIETLERENFAEIVLHAMLSAAARSKELGK